MTGEIIERGVVVRAIVRPTSIVMDVRSDRGEYDISLQGTESGEYRGTWVRDRVKSRGTAGGKWWSCDNPRLFAGRWGHGTVCWSCVLESADSFEA